MSSIVFMKVELLLSLCLRTIMCVWVEEMKLHTFLSSTLVLGDWVTGH